MSYADEKEIDYTRPEHLIEDGIQAIINAKKQFLAALDEAAKHTTAEAIEDYYIDFEQQWDDMMAPAWDKLCDELKEGYGTDRSLDYPRSPRYSAWLASQRPARPSMAEGLFQSLKPPTREELERILRPVPTNQATPGFAGNDGRGS